MLPIGPPYHTVAGNTITIYLNIENDTDSTLGLAIDNALAQLAVEWTPIAIANNLTLVFALGSDTPAPTASLAGVTSGGINDLAIRPPNSPGLNFISGATAPSGVNFFNFKIGRGKNADKNTRSARISYVRYRFSRGYIYQIPQILPLIGPEISHELGHVLGLSDRYYEAVFWLTDHAVNMTCKEIRKGDWVDANGIDRRFGIPDPDPSIIPPIDTSVLPRLAVRASLPIRILGEGSINNLMSDGTPSLTTFQINTILAGTDEKRYREQDWIAILGDWKVHPQVRNPTTSWVPPGSPPPIAPATTPSWLPTFASDLVTANLQLFPATEFNDASKWRYPAREATPQEGGKGILLGPPDHTILHRYGCVRFLGKGKNGGAVIQRNRVAYAKGKKWMVGLHGKQKNPTYTNNPHWMCHVRRLINDLI